MLEVHTDDEDAWRTGFSMPGGKREPFHGLMPQNVLVQNKGSLKTDYLHFFSKWAKTPAADLPGALSE